MVPKFLGGLSVPAQEPVALSVGTIATLVDLVGNPRGNSSQQGQLLA